MQTTSLAQDLRYVLKHWHERSLIAQSPLCQRLAAGARPLTPDELRTLLLEQIEYLRPSGAPEDFSLAPWRRYQHLILRTRHGYSLERVAEELQVSVRQASRDFHEVIMDLDVLLRTLILHAQRSRDVPLPDQLPLPDPTLLTPELPSIAGSTSSPTSLATIANGAITTITELARPTVDWIVSFPETLPAVAGDPQILRQALLHILQAAAESWPDQRLSLTATTMNQEIMLTIQPETPPYQPPIKPYPTAARLLERAKQLLHPTAVILTMTPEKPALTLRIPAEPSYTVLIIDDNPDFALLFSRWVGESRYRFLVATTGEIALRMVQETQPDLIILDVLLPNADGWEVLRQIRRLPQGSPIPVAVCSVLPERELALSLNVFDFLPKPVTRPALQRLLQRCFAGPEWHQDQPTATASLPLPGERYPD
ncbi:MAG: response regulator [Chloroflexi bacterium]|nr:response regulator [Chloroflexota bacterium]MCL5947489.1 response regulator [Chloroflexota bacterium]